MAVSAPGRRSSWPLRGLFALAPVAMSAAWGLLAEASVSTSRVPSWSELSLFLALPYVPLFLFASRRRSVLGAVLPSALLSLGVVAAGLLAVVLIVQC